MSKKSRLFVLSWDCLGLEACVDATTIAEEELKEDQQQMWDILADNENKKARNGRNNTLGSIVNMLTLRARFNNHRHYEVYSVNTEYSVTEQDMRSMFENDPQGSADLIRARGKKLYSDRLETNRVVIR